MNNDTNRCIPKFHSQAWLEFWFLISTFAIAFVCLGAIKFGWFSLCIGHNDKILIYVILGGFLGGWAFDVKWFIRVSAKGKENQYTHEWHSHKFFWRVFTPFNSALVALALFSMTTSDFIPFIEFESGSGKSAFGFGFLAGYFSDALIGKLRDMLKFSDEPSHKGNQTSVD